MTVVCKLGGSVLTHKERREAVDEGALATVADAIAAETPDRLVLVHGGGSFGHPAAAERGISRTAASEEAQDVVAVHRAMRALADRVVEALHARNVGAVPVHPLSSVVRRSDGGIAVPGGVVGGMLDAGFVPMLHGDVAIDRGAGGAAVVSGDELVTALAAAVDAERIGLCSAVPGVLDGDGEVIPSIDRFEDVAGALGGGTATDVTGGMAAKVETLLSTSIPAAIFGPAALPAFLRGEMPGTVVRHG